MRRPGKLQGRQAPFDAGVLYLSDKQAVRLLLSSSYQKEMSVIILVIG